MAFELKITNGIATFTSEHKTKAQAYRKFMVEHLLNSSNDLFGAVDQADMEDAFHELILTNSTKIRVPRFEGADTTDTFQRVSYTIEITDLESPAKWGHGFTFYFAFKGIGESWSEELTASDFRFKLLQTIGNCDGEDLMERIEIVSSYEENA